MPGHRSLSRLEIKVAPTVALKQQSLTQAYLSAPSATNMDLPSAIDQFESSWRFDIAASAERAMFYFLNSISDIGPYTGSTPAFENEDQDVSIALFELWWDQWAENLTSGSYEMLLRLRDTLDKRHREALSTFTASIDTENGIYTSPSPSKSPGSTIPREWTKMGMTAGDINVQIGKREAKRVGLLFCRLSTLDTILDIYEKYGLCMCWADVVRHFEVFEYRANQPTPSLPPMNDRTLEYLSAARALKEDDFKSAAQYFDAIAVMAPKPNGEPPDGRAVRLQLQRDGIIQQGEHLGDFRQRIESYLDIFSGG